MNMILIDHFASCLDNKYYAIIFVIYIEKYIDFFPTVDGFNNYVLMNNTAQGHYVLHLVTSLMIRTINILKFNFLRTWCINSELL